MKEGNYKNSYLDFEWIYNYRLITNHNDIEFREYFKKHNSNFYDILWTQLENVNQANKSYDILFYIHGGGFLLQTSECVVGFLSDFANDVPCIIFSFDYALAPECKLDSMINQCYSAYELLILNLHLFKIKIIKIIIFGDSAGGFLSLSITSRAIQNRKFIPDGLVLIYPCTRVFFRDMTPSALLTLTDKLIESSFLSQLMNITIDMNKYYRGELQLNQDYNFYLTDSNIVQKFPPTFMVVGTHDPIRDECYKLADFLLSNNVEVDLKEFLYFPHGFMNITTLIDAYYYEGLSQMKRYANKIFN